VEMLGLWLALGVSSIIVSYLLTGKRRVHR
jgi:hypothetical protein